MMSDLIKKIKTELDYFSVTGANEEFPNYPYELLREVIKEIERLEKELAEQSIKIGTFDRGQFELHKGAYDDLKTKLSRCHGAVRLALPLLHFLLGFSEESASDIALSNEIRKIAEKNRQETHKAIATLEEVLKEGKG
jgi:hypothetical protein